MIFTKDNYNEKLIERYILYVIYNKPDYLIELSLNKIHIKISTSTIYCDKIKI